MNTLLALGLLGFMGFLSWRLIRLERLGQKKNGPSGEKETGWWVEKIEVIVRAQVQPVYELLHWYIDKMGMEPPPNLRRPGK